VVATDLQMGQEQVEKVARRRLIFKARLSNIALMVVAVGMGTTVLLAIYDQIGDVPGAVQFGVWVAYVAAASWRVWRVGAEFTTDGVTIRGIFVDNQISWSQVIDVDATESGNTVGTTLVPVVRTARDGYLINWLSGYSWKGDNRRVRRQVAQMSDFWRQIKGSSDTGAA
jgi:hypothetical protein